MSIASVDRRTEVREILWGNYHTLNTTAVQTMEILWSDYENIAKWVVEEHEMTEVDFLVILTELTLFVGSLSADDRRKPAVEFYAEHNQGR